MAKNRVISVSANPADAVKSVASALSRVPINRFRFEEQEIPSGRFVSPEIAEHVLPSKTIAIFCRKGVGKRPLLKIWQHFRVGKATNGKTDTSSRCVVRL